MAKTNRDTISVNDCQILAHYKFEADQFILTLESQDIAEATRPGQFVHLSVSGSLAMRRPISVMSVDKNNGTFDLLYKIATQPAPPTVPTPSSQTLWPVPFALELEILADTLSDEY